MTEKEVIQRNIEDLKAILTASGTNITDIDRIKE